MHTKRISGREYKAMIGMKRAREEEQPGKETRFRLRGVEVEDSKIERFSKRTRLLEHQAVDDTGKDLTTYEQIAEA